MPSWSIYAPRQRQHAPHLPKRLAFQVSGQVMKEIRTRDRVAGGVRKGQRFADADMAGRRLRLTRVSARQSDHSGRCVDTKDIGGELQRLIDAEGIGQPEITRRFLGYITVSRIAKGQEPARAAWFDGNEGEKPASALAGANHTHLPELLFLPIVAAILLGAVAFNVTDHGPALPYVGLFVTSLIAGTMLPFLPGSSEMAMAGLLATGVGAPALLIATAIVGNVIGATANYLVGWNMARFSGRRWFSISPATLQKTTDWFRRYGIWLILLCWLPTAGDAITVVAGVLRADLRVFLILTSIGKAFGHVVVASGVISIS